MTTTPNPAPVTTSDAERAAFEAWAGTLQSWVPNVDRIHPSGPYKSLATASAWSAWKARSALPIDFKQATDQGGWQPEAIADRVVRTVGEMDDRTSPEDWPEAMLVTGEELHAIILQAFEQEAEAAQPCASQGCGGAGTAREANSPLTAWAIELLVAAGHVSREKADEAYRIACETFDRERAALSTAKSGEHGATDGGTGE